MGLRRNAIEAVLRTGKSRWSLPSPHRGTTGGDIKLEECLGSARLSWFAGVVLQWALPANGRVCGHQSGDGHPPFGEAHKNTTMVPQPFLLPEQACPPLHLGLCRLDLH